MQFLDRLEVYSKVKKPQVCLLFIGINISFALRNPLIFLKEEEPKYTFKPYINPATKSMVEIRQSRQGEQFLEKFERLSFHDKQKADQSKQALQVRVGCNDWDSPIQQLRCGNSIN